MSLHYLGMFQVTQKTQFLRQKEKQTVTASFGTASGSTHAVDVFLVRRDEIVKHGSAYMT